VTKKQFVERIHQAALVAKAKGARFNIAVVCAQSALESGWGNSGLTVKACNLFGIKAGSQYRGETITLMTREWSREKGWYKVPAKWRVYKSWGECLTDYAAMLHRLSWFRDALDHVADADAFLKALLPEPGQPGWATDPDYFHKVRAVGYEIEKLGGPKWEEAA
jgi:flagellum-specific peptidoglycan hydrolase FlgJ